MYPALWRVLPGPAWVKAMILVMLVAAVVVTLVAWVFPWVQDVLGLDEVVIGAP